MLAVVTCCPDGQAPGVLEESEAAGTRLVQCPCWLCRHPQRGARKCWGERVPSHRPNLRAQDIRIPSYFKSDIHFKVNPPES